MQYVDFKIKKNSDTRTAAASDQMHAGFVDAELCKDKQVGRRPCVIGPRDSAATVGGSGESKAPPFGAGAPRDKDKT